MSKVALIFVVVMLVLAIVLLPISIAKSVQFAVGAFVVYVGYLGLYDMEEVDE